MLRLSKLILDFSAMFVNLSTVNRANEVDEIKSCIEDNPNGVESNKDTTKWKEKS